MVRRQLSVSLPPEKLEELKKLLIRSGGVEVEGRRAHEAYRIRLDGKLLIAYLTGTIVFHEELAPLVSSMFKGFGVRVGIDEVGKGEAGGPLVVCAVAFDDEGREKAVLSGVIESKMLNRNKASEIARKVREAAISAGIVVISPEEFKKFWKKGNLNELLAKWHAIALKRAISTLKRVDEILVDSFDERRLRTNLEPIAKDLGAKLTLEEGADRKYIEVAAASALAAAIRADLIRKGMRSKKWGTS